MLKSRVGMITVLEGPAEIPEILLQMRKLRPLVTHCIAPLKEKGPPHTHCGGQRWTGI